MTQDIPTHAWFTEQIATYLTQGLDAEERARFESHAELCPDCQSRLADSKIADESLRGLFADVGPSANFEDRVIRRLREAGKQRRLPSPKSIRLHPMVIRAAGFAAAAVFLAGLGYGGLALMQYQSGSNRQNKLASNFGPQPNLANWQNALSYNGASPNPSAATARSEFKIINGLAPTFAVAGDINPEKHGKDGKNVFGPTGALGRSGGGTPPPAEGNRQSGELRPQLRSDAPFAKRLDAETPKSVDSLYFKPATLADADTMNWKLDRSKDSKTVDFQNQPAAGADFGVAAPTAVANDSTLLPTDDVDGAPGQTPTTPFNSAIVQQSLKHRVESEGLPNVYTAGGNSATPPPNPAPHVPIPEQIPAPADTGRKIIRHGEMSFEVDSFDSAFATITKIATEEGGFVADTNSEKLANGKMSGTITVRVPPDHLDTLTLKLRGLGDLKGQKITADDITREFTDLQSELRAAKAMEDRLLEIIKSGNGQVKDLLAAEKELGVWREKVEKVTGEINYYNNLVSLSTLQITVAERDIRQAALASEQETVNMGIETEDVEKARAEALRTLDEVKASIIQSDLKKFEAGQLAATITARVSPQSAGPVIDHLKQLGRVARLDIDRQQSVANGATLPPGVKVQRLDTQLQISLYNLANVSPRQTTNVAMACDDVEKAYHEIISRVTDAGGRIVNSSLNRVKPDQTDGVISFETPDQKADAVLADVRALGEVMHLTVTENPDAANVTTAKRGFAVTLASLATVAPRETIASTLMPGGDVGDAYHAILSAAQSAHANVTAAQLEEQNSQSASGTLAFDLSRGNLPEIEKAIAQALGPNGRVIARQTSRSSDTEHTVDSKIQFALTLASADALAPRVAITRILVASDVGGAYNAILAAAQQAQAKIVVAQLDQSNQPNSAGQLDLIIPRQGFDAVEKSITDAKTGLISKSVTRSPDLNATTDERIELHLTIGDLDQLPPRQTTTLAVDVSDPEKSSGDIQAAALAAGGRIVEQSLLQNDRYQAHLVIDVPLSKESDFINQARQAGTMKNIQQTRNLSVPDADFAHARLDLSLNGETALVGQDTGLWASLKTGLSTSIRGLLYSFELIVIGICLVVPWIAAGWAAWKGAKHFHKRSLINPNTQPGV